MIHLGTAPVRHRTDDHQRALDAAASASPLMAMMASGRRMTTPDDCYAHMVLIENSVISLTRRHARWDADKRQRVVEVSQVVHVEIINNLLTSCGLQSVKKTARMVKRILRDQRDPQHHSIMITLSGSSGITSPFHQFNEVADALVVTPVETSDSE